jgi:NTE family protein
MLSNFPIREFHSRWDVKPRFPTFGVLLNENTSQGKGVPPAAAIPEPFPPVSLGKFLISFFSTFRNFYDNDFLYQNEEISQRIETVNTKGFNWLNFWMSNSEKQQLFAEGARAAIRQLEKFNWNKYKEMR